MKLKFNILLVLSVLFTPAIAANVYAFEVNKTFSGIEIKWDSTGVSYGLNPSGGPAGALAALQASMETWSEVETADFAFVYNGITSSSAYGTLDYENIVAFGELPEGILAENTCWYYTSTGEILDSDIEANLKYNWATDGSPSTYDLQNVCTHEFGHSLSLDDLYDASDADKTMYGYAAPGETKKKTLDEDDINGIAYLYPCLSPPCSANPGFFYLIPGRSGGSTVIYLK